MEKGQRLGKAEESFIHVLIHLRAILTLPTSTSLQLKLLEVNDTVVYYKRDIYTETFKPLFSQKSKSALCYSLAVSRNPCELLAQAKINMDSHFTLMISCQRKQIVSTV